MRALLLTVLLFPVAASAQLASVPSGARVRVRSDSVGRQIGVLLQPIGDSIVIQRRRGGAVFYRIDTVRAAMRSISSLEVSRGRSLWGSGKRGALVGAIAGAAVGVYLAGGTTSDSRSEPRLSFGVIGGALGAIGGLIIGAPLAGERWERVIP